MIESVNIKNYKRFKELTLDNFGDLNLIVGENGIGKTSVLEAITLAANGKNPHYYFNILKSRSHYARDQDEVIESFFYNSVSQGENDDHPTITSYFSKNNRPGEYSFEFYRVKEKGLYNFNDVQKKAAFYEICYKHPAKDDEVGEHKVQVISGEDGLKFGDVSLCDICLKARFLPFGINSDPEFFENLNEIVKNKRAKSDFIEKLKIVQSDIEDILPNGNSISVYLKNNDQAQPLSALGTGFARLFEIFLCLTMKPDVILLDEIDSGIHYTVMPSVWKAIYQIAREEEIQVFATTHSDDCVKAFSSVANDDPAEGAIIRLMNSGGKIIQTHFNEQDMENANEMNLELR